MFAVLLILIFIRPFISSLAFPYLNLCYSAILLGFFAAWFMRKGVALDKIKPLSLPLLSFILALAISSIFSIDKPASFKELYKYAAGLLVFSVSFDLTEQERGRLLSVILLAGVLISILALYQYFFGFRHLSSYVAKHEISRPFVLDYINRRRVFFPFVTPNTLAGYLIMILPLAFIQKKTSWFALPVFAALLLTQSLGSIFSIFVAALIVSILRGKMKGKIFYLAALAAAAGIVFLLRAELGEEHFRPAFSTLMRLNYWKETLQIIKLHPFLGIGPGNLNLTYSRYAHNSYLQLWAETGISGIIAFLWLIITMLKLGFKDINAGQAKAQTAYLLCAILAFIIHNFMDFTFFLPEVSLIWWAILGCLSSCHLPKQRQAQRPQ